MIKALSGMYAPLGQAGMTMEISVGSLCGAILHHGHGLARSNARFFCWADGLIFYQGDPVKPKDDKTRSQLLLSKVLRCSAGCFVRWFIFVPAPVSFVLVGGVAQALMLPFLSIAALYFRYKQTDEPLQPGTVWTVFLWISALAMSGVGLFQLYQKITGG